MKEFTLTSGKKVELLSEPLGRHFRIAQKMINGDQSMFSFALAAQLLKVDGKEMSMSDFDMMPFSDCTECILIATTGSLTGDSEKK
jgi:hypothetical protein